MGKKNILITHPVWIGLATGLTLSEVSVAGLLGIRESSSYSFGKGTGVCWGQRGRNENGKRWEIEAVKQLLLKSLNQRKVGGKDWDKNRKRWYKTWSREKTIIKEEVWIKVRIWFNNIS